MNKNLGVVVSPKISTKKSIGLLFAGLILVIALSAGLFWHYVISEPNVNHSTANALLTQTYGKPVPKASNAKVQYYLDLGEGFMDANMYKEALDACLNADSYITDRSATADTTANIYLYRSYKGLGDGENARKYLQREIKRIKPEASNAGVVSSLESLEREL